MVPQIAPPKIPEGDRVDFDVSTNPPQYFTPVQFSSSVKMNCKLKICRVHFFPTMQGKCLYGVFKEDMETYYCEF